MFYYSLPLPITPHFYLTLPTTFYYSPSLPITLHTVSYNFPLRSISPYRFLAITPHRVLLFPTVSYHSSLVLSFSTASCHRPPRPIPPIASYHSAPLPITLRCVLIFPTTLYHSTPFPIPPNCFVSLPTTSHHSPPFYHSPPRPGSSRRSLSLYITTLCFVVKYNWGPFLHETNKQYAPTTKHSTARLATE